MTVGTAPFHVKCDRWDDCQRRLADACEALACPYRDTHQRIDERLEQLEEREDKQDASIEEVRKVGQGIREELAGMRGQLKGALEASKVSGAVIGALVSAGISGLGGLLLYILSRKG